MFSIIQQTFVKPTINTIDPIPSQISTPLASQSLSNHYFFYGLLFPPFNWCCHDRLSLSGGEIIIFFSNLLFSLVSYMVNGTVLPAAQARNWCITPDS